MKRTVTINIAGISFVADEDAYSLLNNYFEEIRSRVVESSEETLLDVESRVAEILREKGADNVRVITINLVEYVISVIGQPEVFGNRERRKSDDVTCSKERLMRDGSSKILGGVCSGVAAYLGLDTTLVRILTFILTFVGGVVFLIYIVLWIVLPIAKTPQEKAMMQQMKDKI